MKIAIGSDHAGFLLKETLRNWLEIQGYEVIDCGTYSEERADYPVYGQAVALKVSSHEVDFGVLVCGSGQGICMAANKVAGVRAAVIRDNEDSEMTRAHNDANIACFGERITDSETAIAALQVFLNSPFEGGRHEGRVKLLDDIDAGKTIC